MYTEQREMCGLCHSEKKKSHDLYCKGLLENHTLCGCGKITRTNGYYGHLRSCPINQKDYHFKLNSKMATIKEILEENTPRLDKISDDYLCAASTVCPLCKIFEIPVGQSIIAVKEQVKSHILACEAQPVNLYDQCTVDNSEGSVPVVGGMLMAEVASSVDHSTSSHIPMVDAQMVDAEEIDDDVFSVAENYPASSQRPEYKPTNTTDPDDSFFPPLDGSSANADPFAADPWGFLPNPWEENK